MPKVVGNSQDPSSLPGGKQTLSAWGIRRMKATSSFSSTTSKLYSRRSAISFTTQKDHKLGNRTTLLTCLHKKSDNINVFL